MLVYFDFLFFLSLLEFKRLVIDLMFTVPLPTGLIRVSVRLDQGSIPNFATEALPWLFFHFPLKGPILDLNDAHFEDNSFTLCTELPRIRFDSSYRLGIFIEFFLLWTCFHQNVQLLANLDFWSYVCTLIGLWAYEVLPGIVNNQSLNHGELEVYRFYEYQFY